MEESCTINFSVGIVGVRESAAPIVSRSLGSFRGVIAPGSDDVEAEA